MEIIRSRIVYTASSGGGGTGLTSFTVGNLSPLFTASLGADPLVNPALTFAAINQNVNLVYAGPATGAAAAPTFRALVASDLPSNSGAYWKTVGTSGLTGTTLINGIGTGTELDILLTQPILGVADSPIRIGSDNSNTIFTGFRITDILEAEYAPEMIGSGSSIIVGTSATIQASNNNLVIGASGLTVTLNGTNTFSEAADYSANYIPLSYITKGYADATYASISTVAGHVIENVGTPLTQRANLNFTGGLSASDNSPDTDVKLGSASSTGANGILGTRYINVGTDVDSSLFEIRANYLNLVSRGSKLVFNTTPGTSSAMTLTSQSNFGDATLNFTSSGAAGETATVIFTDSRSVKLGIQYAASGYVTDDRSLTDRGYVLGAKTYAGTQTFLSSGLELNNPADTFQYIFAGSAIVADRTVTLPLLTGNDTFVFNDFAATLTNKTLDSGTVFSAIPTINDGITFTFNPNATVSGINVGSQAGNVSTVVNGNIWYNSSTGSLNTNKLNTTHSIITSPSLTSTANQIPFITGTSNSVTYSPNLTFVTNRLIGTTLYLTLSAGTATAGTAPLVMTSGTNLTAAISGAVEYNNTFHMTNSDATRRHVVLAPNTTKVTAGAPYANDGYIVMNIGGTDFKVMTTA